MPKIFISYRREDSQWPARSLRDALVPHVRDPRTDIFMDIDNIPLGVNFADHIGAQVAGCDVLLALIGPGWVSLENEHGRRRLDDPKDFVRLEIAQALKRGIPVVPVLLDGVAMLKIEQLPDDLRELAMRNGVEVRHATFAMDAERLIRGLGLSKEPKKTNNPAAPRPSPSVVKPPAMNKSARAPFLRNMPSWLPSAAITGIVLAVVLFALFDPFDLRGPHMVR
jgi:hypothetical protein